MIIAPAYFAVGYLSWTLARIFLRATEYKLQGAKVFLVPLISAFVMASWDFAQDPVNATIAGSWIWTSGGPYWGVPFINFIPGWFLTVYVFFQLFALYLNGKNVRVTDPVGKTWMTGDIYQSMGLATFFTLVFMSVLALTILAVDWTSVGEDARNRQVARDQVAFADGTPQIPAEPVGSEMVRLPCASEARSRRCRCVPSR